MRKIKLKFSFLAVCIALLLSFAACEGANNSNRNDDDKDRNKTELTKAPDVSATPDAPTPTPTPTPTEVPSETARLFEEYTVELFKSEIVLNTLNLHYTLAYPENYGITDYEVTLGTADYEEMQKSYEALKELETELQQFAYDELTNEQQFTYDILMDYIETELMAADYLLYMEFLGPVTGYQAQLPVMLAEYTFRCEQDVEDYLELLTCIDDVFLEILEFEQLKSENGLFMSDEVADEIIDQCSQFIENPEENYMIEVFDSKMEEIDFLTDGQKKDFMEENRALITGEVVNAYTLLIDGLTELQGTGINPFGLAYYPAGSQYYQYLVRAESGSEKSVDDLFADTTLVIYKNVLKLQQLIRKDPELYDAMLSYEYCETEPEAMMKDLIQKISGVFPELEDVNYTIKYVHPSMQEHLSPAFYLTPPIDDYTNNVIYINEGYYNEDLYTTVAHEGFPGHLYQTVYTASKGLPLIRNLFGYSGYTEGWATYVEFMAYNMGGLEENLGKLLEYNAISMLGIHAAVDMGIHYYGWTVAEVESFLTEYGLGGTEVAQSLFDYIMAEPGAYISYFVGYMEWIDLKETAEKVWKDDYSDMRFYDVTLSLGPAPFALLEKEIRELAE